MMMMAAAAPDSGSRAGTEALGALTRQVAAVSDHINGLTRRIREGTFRTDKGLSFLEVKNQMLSLYLSDLTYTILQKVLGRSLREQPAVLRLVEVRTVLEKMRPIDQKLRYQIDKLIKTTVTGSLADNNPLAFKPNPANMLTEMVGDEESELEGEMILKKPESVKSRKVYVPPRLVPMPYNSDRSKSEQEQRLLERAQKRALGGSVIRELREQYTDAPEELREGREHHTMRQDREHAHRMQYEEAMMIRLNVTKTQRDRGRRSLAMTSQLGSLTHFGNVSVLTGEAGDSESAPRPKKRKIVRKHKGKAFRRRR
ncbi:neuroguidin [Chiloscyllium punctatum]|uniref:neuroguidin n=1 Tax=Chiloscyllium punctatum TaxID=137246 RepID=UPI003B634553